MMRSDDPALPACVSGLPTCALISIAFAAMIAVHAGESEWLRERIMATVRESLCARDYAELVSYLHSAAAALPPA